MGNSVVFPSRKEGPISKNMKKRLYFCGKDPHEEEKLSTNSKSMGCLVRDRTPTQTGIPYLLFKEETEPSKSQYLMIYFHGNSAVLGKSYTVLERYHQIYKISILSPEYPGYGLYENALTSEPAILADAELMIRYCIDVFDYKEENIILMGRSLGTGVASRMGTIFPNLKGIILISPYLAIRDVARNKVGWLLSKAVPDIFRTTDIIDKVKAPILFIHGLRDSLVPSASSSSLHERTGSSVKMLHFSPTMEHKKIDFETDLYLPILTFFAEKLEMVEFKEQYLKETENRSQSQNCEVGINLEKSQVDSPSQMKKEKISKANPTDIE